MKRHGCKLFDDGAQRAASSSRCNCARSTGSLENARGLQRPAISSWMSTIGRSFLRGHVSILVGVMKSKRRAIGKMRAVKDDKDNSRAREPRVAGRQVAATPTDRAGAIDAQHRSRRRRGTGRRRSSSRRCSCRGSNAACRRRAPRTPRRADGPRRSSRTRSAPNPCRRHRWRGARSAARSRSSRARRTRRRAAGRRSRCRTHTAR